MKNRLAVGLGLAFCLSSAVVMADEIQVPDLSPIGKGQIGYISLSDFSLENHVNYTLKCDVSTDSDAMSFGVYQYRGQFGLATVDFGNGDKFSQNGSIDAVKSKSKTATLIIHNIVQQSRPLHIFGYSDNITFRNDGDAEDTSFGALTFNHCTLTSDNHTASFKENTKPNEGSSASQEVNDPSASATSVTGFTGTPPAAETPPASVTIQPAVKPAAPSDATNPS